ncbi:LamG-like jellyroll fold domain-containing protein [Bacteroides sp.]
MKRYLGTLFLLFCVTLSYAQVDNYALAFDGTGSVNYRKIDELNGLSAYTLQFWMYPSEWTNGATVFTRGSGPTLFEVRLSGTPGKVILQSGAQSVAIESELLAVSVWTHLTLIVDGSRVASYVNGVLLSDAVLDAPLTIPDDGDMDFLLGKNFKGRLDEFRIWKAALDENKYLAKDPSIIGFLLWDNTLNKYHPQYDDLLLYCKFDQNLCANIVDYMFRHHGIMNEGVERQKVTDNTRFRYRIVTGYFEMNRFMDVPTDKERYLLFNDVLSLMSSMNNDGTISINPYDKGVLSGGAAYLDNYEGHNGVLSLDGTGKMSTGTSILNSAGYSFATWLYIDDWVEDAFIIRREKDEHTGISLRLGKEESSEVILRVNGNEYKYKRAGALEKKRWIHFAFSPNSGNNEPARTFIFVCDKNQVRIYPYAYPPNVQSTQLPLEELKDVECVLGENFKGKLDETVVWNAGKYASNLAGAANEQLMPTFGQQVSTDVTGGYWKYDKSENPGHDSFSYVEFMDIVRSAYKGYRGYKIRLCITGGGNWVNIIANEEMTKRCAESVAALVNGSNTFSGVDFDLEWPEYGGQGTIWTNYGKFIEVVRRYLDADRSITISPHTVSYWFPKDKMQYVDYFLFQNYGPAQDHFTYESFPTAYNKFLAWGYPKEKIVMSYANSTSKDAANGAAPARVYSMGETGPDDNGDRAHRLFMSYDQVRWRGEQVKKQDLGGIMTWSMSIDYPDTRHPYNRARSSAYALSSNVDTLVTKVDMSSVGLERIGNKEAKRLVIYFNPDSKYISFKIPVNKTVESVMIFNMQGQCVLNVKTREKTVSVAELPKGSYCLNVNVTGGESFKELFVRL